MKRKSKAKAKPKSGMQKVVEAAAKAKAAKAATVNLGPCLVAGCRAPGVEEINWPSGLKEIYCGPHGIEAKAGRLKRARPKR